MLRQGLLAPYTTRMGMTISKFLPKLAGSSLDFDFENNQYYTSDDGFTNAVSSITGYNFTRSNGTYFDSSGNIVTAPDNTLRLDHDPVTLEPLGFLHEEQRTNIADMSSPVAGDWSNTGTGFTQTDAGLNVLGQFGGVIASSGGSDFHRMNHPQINLNASDETTATIYVREGTSGQFRFIVRNLDTGLNSITQGPIASLSVTSVAAGAMSIVSNDLLADGLTRRIIIRFTALAGTRFQFGIGPNANVAGENIIVCGFQLELGEFATSFIPTDGTTVTRTADRLFLDNIQTSTWFNALEGSMYADFKAYDSSGDSGDRVIDLGEDGSNFIRIGRPSVDAVQYRVQVGGVGQSSINTGLWNDPNKASVAYKLNDFGYSLNGATATQDNAGTLPTGITRCSIGSNFLGDGAFNGHIKRISIWTERLSNLRLEAMSAGLLTAIPLTENLTISGIWDNSGTNYAELADTSEFSAGVVADLDTTSDGVLFESGGTGTGLIVYTFNGNLYFQCGDGTAFGDDTNRIELVWPIENGRHLVEVSAEDTGGSRLYVDGELVDSGTFISNPGSLAGSDAGGWMNVRSNAAVNRGGWTTSGTGMYPEAINSAYVYEGQTI